MPVRLAITVLGALAAIAIAAATYLTAAGHDAAVAWALATTPVGAIAGILVPTRPEA